MRAIRLGAAVSAAIVAVAVAGGVAMAAPQKGDVITLHCGGDGDIDILVNSNGAFSPGHIVGSNQVVIPTTVDITGTFTPAGGGEPEPFEEHDAKHSGPPKGANVLECTFHEEFADEFGTAVVDGSVTGFIPGKPQ